MQIGKVLKLHLWLYLWLVAAARSSSAATPDISITLNEAAVNEAAQQLIGLEIILANGAQLRLTSVTLELQSQQAAFQLGVQARAASTAGLPLNLTLKGFVREAVHSETKLTLPIELTEVQFANGLLTPLLRLLFGEWLTPQRWSAAIPALELPATMAHPIDMPATTVDVAGALPMTVTTQALQIPLNFALTRVDFAENSLWVALQLPVGPDGMEYGKAADQVESISEPNDSSLAVSVSRHALGVLLQSFANASGTDLTLRLKPARIRQEQIDTIVSVTNYTDVESGEGQADLKQIAVEQLRDGLLGVRLLAQGNFNAKVNGREYGIPYRLSPRGQFGIQDRGLSLRLMNGDGRVWLQAVPGAQLPVDVRLNFPIVGREVGFDRQINLPAERVFNRWELPALWAREFALPRKVVVQADKTLQIIESRPLSLSLTQLQAQTRDDMVRLVAAVSFTLR